MTCTTVTGRGLGSADQKQKGSEHARLGVDKLIGPRCVVVGKVTLSGGTATVTLPVLPGTTADYVVMATDQTAANAVATSMTITAGTGTTLTFTGTTTHVIQYAVFNTGMAISMAVHNNTLP
jgi:hypothetical protein